MQDNSNRLQAVRGNGGSMSETGVTSHDMELNWEVTTWFHSFSLTKVRHSPNGVDEAYDTQREQRLRTESIQDNFKRGETEQHMAES